MKEREVRREKNRITPLLLAFILVVAACKPQSSEATETFEPTPTPETEDIDDSEFPLLADLHLVTGPHHIARKPGGIRSAVDFAPAQLVLCFPGDKKSIKDVKVVAPKSGTVTVAGGDKNNRNDPAHSIVEIRIGKSGYSIQLVHVDEIKVEVGQKVKRNQEIGVVSCEVPGPNPDLPKGGTTDQAHVHEDFKHNGTPIPADGRIISGWEIKEGKNPGEGTMKKKDEYAVPNYTVTADTRRCGPSKESIQACGGIRNDIPHPKLAKPGVVGPGKTP